MSQMNYLTIFYSVLFNVYVTMFSLTSYSSRWPATEAPVTKVSFSILFSIAIICTEIKSSQ